MKILLHLEHFKFSRNRNILKLISLLLFFNLIVLIVCNIITSSDNLYTNYSFYLSTTNIFIYPFIMIFSITFLWGNELKNKTIKYLFRCSYDRVDIIIAKKLYLLFIISVFIFSSNLIMFIFLAIKFGVTELVIGYEMISTGMIFLRILTISILEVLYFMALSSIFELIILLLKKTSIAILTIITIYLTSIIVVIPDRLWLLKTISIFRGTYLQHSFLLDNITFIQYNYESFLVFGCYLSLIMIVTIYHTLRKQIY